MVVVIGGGVRRSIEKLSCLIRVLSGLSAIGSGVECTPVDVPS